MFAPGFIPHVLPSAEFWSLFWAEQGGLHPSIDLLRAILLGAPPESWELDPYKQRWLRELVRVPDQLRALVKQDIQVFTDGSSKFGEDSGAAAVFTIAGKELLTVRVPLRPSPVNFLPECCGCLLAVKFSPLNLPLQLICDCDSALHAASKLAPRLSWRRRLTAAARPVLESCRAILEVREANTEWRSIKSHVDFDEGDGDAFFNQAADTEAKQARSAAQGVRLAPRIWSYGAEPAMLCTRKYPTMREGPIPGGALAQVVGSVKGFLRRSNRVALAREAALASTMGMALRYNGERTLALSRLLSRTTASSLHITIAMALASYLPLQNRSDWSASTHPIKPRCRICMSGLKQDSAHIFNCPARRDLGCAFFSELERGLELCIADHCPSVGRLEGPVAHKDLLRDQLVSHFMCPLREGSRMAAPLSGTELDGVPPMLLRLAATWTSLLRDSDLDALSTGGSCLGGAWLVWEASLRREIRLDHPLPADALNCAPHPSFWHYLGSLALPKPFHAVVFDGAPTLGPPDNLVWYTAHPLRTSVAWWSFPLPSSGEQMRLFDWTPLADLDEIRRRAGLYREAVVSSPESVFMMLIPGHLQETDLNDVLEGTSTVFSTGFFTDLCKPMSDKSVWDPRPIAQHEVRTLLIVHSGEDSIHSTLWTRAGLSMAEMLRSRVACPVSPRLTSQFSTPAGWWWGPTRWTTPRGASCTTPTPMELFDAGRCKGGLLCSRTCSPSMEVIHPYRYFGNLGVPPPEVLRKFGDRASAVFDGDRLPPTWLLSAWTSVQSLVKSFSSHSRL
jgi:hypothetical protein